MSSSDQSKIRSLSSLCAALRQVRRSKKKIVFTNGCFDILHVGHVRYLAQARALGDILVVGLNSDHSVRKLKGSDRPVCREKDRAEVLAALESIDYVTIFSDATPERLIRKIRPDALVKGGDWKKEHIVGSAFVESYGGTVRSLPFSKGFSTTGLIRRIQSL